MAILLKFWLQQQYNKLSAWGGGEAKQRCATLSNADPIFCVHRPWEHAFSLEKSLEVWVSTSLLPFDMHVYWELLDKEGRVKSMRS